MVVGINGEKEYLESNRYFLGFRDSIILALGFFPPRLTRKSFYHNYKRLHSHLSRSGFISFPLPRESVFHDMIRKLLNEGDIVEIYHQSNYILQLSQSGQGTFDAVLAGLSSHPDFTRITNIYDFSRRAANL